MKRRIRTIVTFIALIVLFTASLAKGEHVAWNCPECGRVGNTGNYCGSCAHPAPWLESFSTPTTTPVIDYNPGDIGSIISLGHYEQDNNTSNGKEDIEWIVISNDQQNGRLLLLSRYALDTKEYYNVYTDTSWSTCNLRSWLNKEFFTTAFTSSEQQYVLTCTINNSLTEQYTMPYDKTINDKNTTDKVFLLSYNEAFNIYFISDDERQCRATDFALSNGVWTTTQGEYVGNCVWILRCKGTGFIDSVDLDGTRDWQRVDMVGAGIRPAIWVKNSIIH